MPGFVTIGASILQAPACALIFVLASIALGRRIQVWLHVTGGSVGEQTLTRLALGAGMLQLVPLAMGAVGVLRIGALRAASLVVLPLLLPDLWATVKEVSAALRALKWPPTWLIAWAVAVFAGLLVPALLALAPTIDPDGLWYHLTVPKRWLQAGSLIYLPTYPNSNMPMGVEMLFSIALSFAGDAGAKAIHFALGAAGAAGLLLAGWRMRARYAGVLAATLYLFGPVSVASLLGVAYIEGVTAFATIVAALAWLVWFETRDAGWLRCAFLIAGICVSFKITAGLVPLALVGLTLVVELNDPPVHTAPRVARWQLLVLSAFPVLPWLIRSAVVTGNPFFPMFAHFIHSRDFAPALAEKWEYFNRYLNWAIVVGLRWSLATRKLILAACALALVLAAAIVWVSARSRRTRGVVVVLVLIALAQLGAVGLYVRYWIPLLSILQLPALALCERWLSGRYQRVLLVLVTLFAGALRARQALRTVDNDVSGLVQTVIGSQDRHAFLQKRIVSFGLYDRINRDLPQDANVLLAYYCGGFYIDRGTYCIDVVQGSLDMSTPDKFIAGARQLRVTHLLAPISFATSALPPPLQPSGVGFMMRQEREDIMARLLAGHARLLESSGDQSLYELDLGRTP